MTNQIDTIFKPAEGTLSLLQQTFSLYQKFLCGN